MMLKISIELLTTTFAIASALKPVSANVEKETSKKKKKKKSGRRRRNKKKEKTNYSFPT